MASLEIQEDVKRLDMKEEIFKIEKKESFPDSLIFSPLDTATLWSAHVSNQVKLLKNCRLFNNLQNIRTV